MNGEPIGKATRAVYSFPMVSAHQSGTYHVEVTSVHGTLLSDKVELALVGSPAVAMTNYLGPVPQRVAEPVMVSSR